MKIPIRAKNFSLLRIPIIPNRSADIENIKNKYNFSTGSTNKAIIEQITDNIPNNGVSLDALESLILISSKTSISVLVTTGKAA